MLPLARHGKAVLQFSGGKDSLACLYMLREHWHRLTVVWANSGAAFPETIEQMREVRAMVPNFVEVKGDQPKHVAAFGPPADVVPVRSSPFGRWAMSSEDAPIQSSLDCCNASIWQPMVKAMAEIGATLVIRGQRLSDKDKSPLRSGQTINGVEYWFPIEKWTDEEVRAYLRNIGVPLPAHYAYVDSSLDCWSCTAFRGHVPGRMRYMKEKHPELHAKCIPMLKRIKEGVAREMAYVEEALSG